MHYLEAVYAVWLREITVFFREKERVISAIVTPLLWIFAFGGGLGASVELQGVNYQTFIFPGVVSMAVLFGSIFYGLYIIWDRKLDFLKLVLVAPIPRSAVFMGKMLGGMSDVLLQVVALMVIGIAFGMAGMDSLVLAVPAALLLSMCIVSLGLIMGASMSSPDGFNLVMSFVMWPMFLFSGALFPVENLPSYLGFIVAINPLTYGVDLIRFAFLGTTAFGPVLDVAVLLGISLAFIFIGTKSFERMQV
ncbi:TPA: ABC transporter permease [Candidatus Micrarchaeota archaeon]|nr:ABC transporter permease [Candidatus Micrarchaeota archaeon]